MNIKYAAILAMTVSLGSASAASFNWDNSVSSSNVASDGSTLNSSFTFEIGALGAGFDLADPTTWVANFITVASDSYNGDGFNEFGATLEFATAPTIGLQPYIFGYSSTAGFGTPGTEGVLFTSANWELFPDPADTVNPTYSVSEVTNVLFGAVEGDPAASGTPGLSNLGSFTHGFDGERIEASPAPVGPFLGDVEIQTFGFAAVPEPSSALLTLLATSGFLLRRRR